MELASTSSAGPVSGDRTASAAVSAVFGPLMRQNEAAYERELAAGRRAFNERAFDRGEQRFVAHRLRPLPHRAFRVRACVHSRSAPAPRSSLTR